MNAPFLDMHIVANLAATLGAVAILVPVRRHLVRRVGAEAPARAARVRLACGAVMALVIAAIWFAEIQSLLWSITAVAVAFVIATKELIQCGTGALMRAAGRSFRIGDRMEIDGIFGEVLAHGILTTTIAEMEKGSVGGHLTGRRIVLPNSRLFSADMRIEARGSARGPLRFHIVFDPAVSAIGAVAVLEESLRRFCEPFAEGSLGESAPAPLVTLGTTELGRVRLDILCFVPVDEAVALEREVKMEFLEWMWGEAQARQARPSADQRFVAVNDARSRVA